MDSEATEAFRTWLEGGCKYSITRFLSQCNHWLGIEKVNPGFLGLSSGLSKFCDWISQHVRPVPEVAGTIKTNRAPEIEAARVAVRNKNAGKTVTFNSKLKRDSIELLFEKGLPVLPFAFDAYVTRPGLDSQSSS